MTLGKLGRALEQYCRDAGAPGGLGMTYRSNGRITNEMLNDLNKVAGTLKQDGNVIMPRVFREIRVSPQEIDQSLTYFYNYV